jgi:archaellum component FlaC
MVADKVYIATGGNKVFTVDLNIPSESHVRVYTGEDDTLSFVSAEQYDVFNNSIVFHEPPDDGTKITIQVASTPDELLTTPTEAGVLSQNIEQINTLYSNIADIQKVSQSIEGINKIACEFETVKKVADDLSETISEIELVGENLQKSNSDINIVADNITDVIDLANLKEYIQPLANEVVALHSIGSNIGTLITIDENLESIKEASAPISTCASNIASIIAAPANAQTAITQADIAIKQAAIAIENAGIAQEARDEVLSRFRGTFDFPPTSGNKDGDLYFDSNLKVMMTYSGTTWHKISHTSTAYRQNYRYIATQGQIDFECEYSNIHTLDVFINGFKVLEGIDYNASSGTHVTLMEPADVNDTIDITVFGAFEIATMAVFNIGHYSDFEIAFNIAKA